MGPRPSPIVTMQGLAALPRLHWLLEPGLHGCLRRRPALPILGLRPITSVVLLTCRDTKPTPHIIPLISPVAVPVPMPGAVDHTVLCFGF